MLNRNLFALSLAAALVAVAPVASAQHRDDRDYRDDHRDYRHDMRRDHRESERERHYEYARHHDYRVYEHAPRGYAVATPVFVPQPVYAQPAPASLNIVVPITLP